MFSCSEKFSGSASSGSTCSSTKARTRRRRSSISGASWKSLPAVQGDGRAGDVAARVRDKEQQRPIEVAGIAEAAHRNLALDGRSRLAHQIIVVHFRDKPSGGNGVNAYALEGQFDRKCL